jgi:hypothetical protein
VRTLIHTLEEVTTSARALRFECCPAHAEPFKAWLPPYCTARNHSLFRFRGHELTSEYNSFTVLPIHVSPGGDVIGVLEQVLLGDRIGTPFPVHIDHPEQRCRGSGGIMQHSTGGKYYGHLLASGLVQYRLHWSSEDISCHHHLSFQRNRVALSASWCRAMMQIPSDENSWVEVS